MHRYIKIVLLGLLLAFTCKSFSQSNRSDALNLYIDCNTCDNDYIRQNISFVNFVRDRKVADVHVIITYQNTGSGGEEYQLKFIGQNVFEGQADTLKFTTTPDNTGDEIRELRLNMLKLGLMQFVAKTGLASEITIDFTSDEEEETIEDKWDSWVFEISGDAWVNGQETYKNTNLYADISAERITPELKMEYELSSMFSNSKFDLGDGEIYISESVYYSFANFVVFSLNEHWSVGESSGLDHATYTNRYLSAYFRPAIEYNIFPYSESSDRQLRINYSIGPQYNIYIDTTIFNKNEELLYRQSLGVAYKVVKPWGSISASLVGKSYMHDLNLNNLYSYVSTDLRLFKGLSLNLSAGASLIRDQIALPKGEATQEDIFLQQREMATAYSYWGSVGVSYTFGSLYNNVVNPRFGN